MTVLDLRPSEDCRWDLVSLGEVMLRLDPNDRRVATTRAFSVWEGGGEYNVARSLRRCFGLRSAIVTALADNDVGRLVEDLIFQGGTDVAWLHWAPYDGVGRTVRNGLNFTERGVGVRAARAVSDRGHTAVSQLQRGDIDWTSILREGGTRWFHCGGVFAGLSQTTPAVAKEAMREASRSGAAVSYDLNYRASLWAEAGGTAAAAETNRSLLEHVDVLVGNEEDFYAGLGYKSDGDSDFLGLEANRYERLLHRVLSDHPQVKLAAVTLREARSATVNSWTAVCATRAGFFEGLRLPNLEIYDRVGGGDSFMSGLVYGLLLGKPIGAALNYGIAHGAVAMTNPGDASMATLADVERVVDGRSARIVR